MSDVLVVAAVVAFFALGAGYVVACARILSGNGDFDEPLADVDGEDDAVADREPELVA